MVFKPINLARSVISKTFPNGYAQSLVAASQSSSASHNTHFSTFNNVTNYFGKTGPTNPAHPTHQNVPTSATGGFGKSDVAGTERGLDAYYAAWQKHHRAEEREWHQFQFAKRIGWKAPTTIPDAQALTAAPESQVQINAEEPAGDAAAQTSDRPAIHRAKSADAIDALKNAETEAPFLGHEEFEHEIARRTPSPDQIVQNDQSSQAATSGDVEFAESATSPFPSLAETSSFSPAQSTQATSVSEIDPYIDHLTFLAENQRHAEIPAVFEAILRNGLKPTPTAYNALLLAAIHLPRGKHQVVPKVLDVYSDMLRRRVAPDTATYAVLVEVLAARAMDVSAMKHDLLRKRARCSEANSEGFVFASDKTEYRILAEDDSLSLAIRLFDTSAAVTTNHAFPAETYRLLISACAEHGRIDDMVRIYAEMESQKVVPPSAIFAPMIEAFASTGDLRSAVECYEEYKSLAIAHDQGLKSIIRRDDEVYAAVVKAYALCGDVSGGLKFLSKIEDSLQGSLKLAELRDVIAVQALIPGWIAQNAHAKALSHSVKHLSTEARATAFGAICVDAADCNNMEVATEALKLLESLNAAPALASSATAVMAAHIRKRDMQSARATWKQYLQSTPLNVSIEPTTMLAVALIRHQDELFALTEARRSFSRSRDTASTPQQKMETLERIDEAISIIGKRLLESSPVVSPAAGLELILIMVENGAISHSLAEHLLAPLGPEEIALLPPSMLPGVIRVQAALLAQAPQYDAGHVARFSHLIDLVGMHGMRLESASLNIVEEALNKIRQPELSSKWQNLRYPSQPPTPYATAFSPAVSVSSPAFDDHFDPYASSTDFKGSVAIAEELEKSYGRHSAHLNEALVKFKNMRRAGRHPRYVTYAKLINAAAKENRLNLANEILAMAKQDIPLIAQSRVVIHGWVSILDAMVGACLTVGKRDLAAQYHNDLLSMGAAPSANTFGLYITTLKESAKTFDEATEAVKIFHRAKTEGVEPTSFLYNALIGKLGKARRIDDCLFHFAEMRSLGIRPTSVTYGTIVNALCRVSDDKFAEELFEEMESMPNYKPRPAPYNSLMQYFLTTKRDRSKVLSYYNRMIDSKIEPTMHTYKLLIDTHATLEPIDLPAAEAVLADIRKSGSQPEAVHYASLIHAKGCVLHDLPGARATFDEVMNEGRITPQASLYQAMFESMVANHEVAATEPLLQQMAAQRVPLTAYIANTLIHGWALVKNVGKARAIYDSLGMDKREPSTYEAMTRAYLAVEEHGHAMTVVGEALRRGYPTAVANKICDLVGGGSVRT